MLTKNSLRAGIAVLAITAAAPAAASAASPYERGPAPTLTSVRSAGGFNYTRIAIGDGATPGFGAAVIYAPTDTTQKYGAVALAPGFTENASVVDWLAARLATQGFATIAFNTTNILDQPNARGAQLLRALDYLTTSSPLASRIDATREAVVGHSMGGGGVLDAARARPALKATVGLEPWHTNSSWPGITTPSLVIGAESDQIAPKQQHAIPIYKGIAASTSKAYIELKGADHFASNKPNVAVAAETVSWLKRYVDNDTRYTQFLVPTPTGPPTGSLNGFASANVS